LSWRDDPKTPPYWIEIADLILAAHPEWESFIVGPQERRGMEMFFVEIPSVHPSIREPLVIEVSDPVPRGMIDTYWNGYFEHDPRWKDTTEQHIAKVVERVESWTSDEFVFSQSYDRETGRRSGRLRRTPDGSHLVIDVRTVYWSWRGTHDRVEE